MDPQILKRFYSCTIESILIGCITAWCGNCSASARKALQRVGRTVGSGGWRRKLWTSAGPFSRISPATALAGPTHCRWGGLLYAH
ncbi:unnamed protein product [Oncorhynchus mykiss]|uniref:Uncharacterized protein n=1 Tax=Oncorhynchus mykiss TaxID=8022 RepID=A0A060WI37_ONCMY|nr:unnamed protein product [Oncorhynchus mykiss]